LFHAVHVSTSVFAAPVTRHRSRFLLALSLPMVIHSSLAANSFTLDEAVAAAEQRNPLLQTARAQARAAQGELDDARAALRDNPDLTTEIRRRALPQAGQEDVSRRDAGVGLSQTFELGGQQRARRDAAEANQRAVNQTIEDARREVRAEAARRFVQVLSLQIRVRMENEALELLARSAASVAKRVEAGEDTRLDGNLASVEAERAANQVAQVREQLVQARVALSTFLQLDPAVTPEAAGELDPPPVSYTLDDLLKNAETRPALRALRAKEQSAHSRLDLERASVYPDLTVGLFYSPEKAVDGTDRITTLSFSLPLPLFRRNAAGIGRAAADADQVEIERRAAERRAQAEVRALWQRAESLRQRVERLRAVVVPALEENQQLSVKALRAGEIGLAQFLLVRRQVLDGERDLLDARTELRLNRIAMETAAGWPERLPPMNPDRSKEIGQ
jgi:outer membrane protein, heavy metal efflux system